jgi:hypothetical protein
MRPDVGDILGQIQRGLMEEVMPEITNPHVMERVAYMLMLLDHCTKRWDRAYSFVRDDHDDLAATVKAIQAERADASAGPVLAGVLREISALASEPLPGAALASSVALREHTDRRKEALSRLLLALASMDLAGHEALRRVRAHAGGYIRHQIAREREWVRDAGEIIW